MPSRSPFAPLVLVLAIGCSPVATTTSRDARVDVLAAASTADLLAGIATADAALPLRIAYGPSSGLARQIVDGAPADVFVTAHPRWMTWLDERGLLAGEIVVIARNTLVCIAAPGSRLAAAAPPSLAELARALAPHERLALAAEGVPAGDYARQALAHLGLTEDLAPRLVGMADVRAVLRAVVAGDVDAGIVYASDARAGGLVPLAEVPAGTHEPIVYQAAVLRDADAPAAARAFLASLADRSLRARLLELGFLAP